MTVALLPLQPELAPQQRAGIIGHGVQHCALLGIEAIVLIRVVLTQREGTAGALGVSLGTLQFT